MCTHLLGRHSDNGYVDDGKMCVHAVSLTYKLELVVVSYSYALHIVLHVFLSVSYTEYGCLLFYRLRLNDDYTEITLCPCSQVKTAQMNIILHMRKRNVERLHQSHCLLARTYNGREFPGNNRWCLRANLY